MNTKAKSYADLISKKRAFIIVLLMATVTTSLISINAGAANLNIQQILKGLLGLADKRSNMVIRGIRLPRVVAGILAGAGLSSAGCIMQNNLRNPLASPSTLGISNAAAFGANVAIILLGAGSVLSTGVGEVVISNPYSVTLVAMFFSLMATAVILGLAKLKNFSPESIVLAGVALSSLFSAGTTIIQYFAEDTTKVAAVIFWTFGDLGRASWKEIFILAVVVLFSILYFYARRWDYNALDSGEETAKSLGVDIERIRLGGMLVSSVISAVCVSFLGIIAFIGLVAPQITKRLIGNDNRFLIPGSALMGAVILLLSDTAARVLFEPTNSASGGGDILSRRSPLSISSHERWWAFKVILSVKYLSFSYPSRKVLERVSFSIVQGECISILGTNGTGKSTLLKNINRILEPECGVVYIDGEDISRMARRGLAQKIGYIAQKQSPMRCTVFDAVLLGRKPHIHWDVDEEDIHIVEKVLSTFNLEDYALRYTDELSGGELQKVAIARALAQEPEILLMDEPTSNLDIKNQMEVIDTIKEIVETQGIAVVVTMHDLNLALRFADKFLMLKDGKVFAAGGREIITRENIKAVYDVEVEIKHFNEIPLVVPL